MRPRVNSRTKYLNIDLTVNGKNVTKYVHHLVLAAYSCRRPAGQETWHLNGDRSDNRPSNLAWGTHSENMQDAISHGTFRNMWM